MDSPVSGVVAEVVRQNIEEQALTTYKQTLPLWLRHVDETFTAVHEDEINAFHEPLNRQNTYSLPGRSKKMVRYLCRTVLAFRDGDRPRTTIYRKPTHRHRLLDVSSYNPTSHNATAVRTWRWLPLRLSKRQSTSSATVLIRTTYIWTIKLIKQRYPGFTPFTKTVVMFGMRSPKRVEHEPGK